MIDVTDADKYLSVVVDGFRESAATLTGFELRKKLWHACVVVCEVTQNYEDWHLTLAKVAYEQGGLKESAIVATVKSARRKAGVA